MHAACCRLFRTPFGYVGSIEEQAEAGDKVNGGGASRPLAAGMLRNMSISPHDVMLTSHAMYNVSVATSWSGSVVTHMCT